MTYTFEQKPSLEDLVQVGVKGMRWGVRNDKKRSSGGGSKASSGSKPKRQLSRRQKQALGVAAIGGLIVASVIVQQRSGVKMSDLNPQVSRMLDASKAQVNRQQSNGAAQVSRMLNNSRGQVNRQQANGAAQVARGRTLTDATLRRVGSQQFSAIPMPPASTPRPSARSRALLSRPGEIGAIRESLAATVKMANADLRDRYNRNDTPIPERSYLKEWD